MARPFASHEAPRPAPAPTDGSSRILVFLGVVMMMLSLASFGIATAVLPLGALFVWLGWRQRVVGRAAMRTHASLQAITRGQIETAESHLAAIPKRLTKRGTVMRAVAFQRALVAFYRGDAKTATTLLEPAIGEKTGSLSQGYELMQRSVALSLRALAFASMGEGARARADAEAVRAAPHATPEALARAALADAVALAREGKLDELAACFRAHGSLILEHTLPRERVLARALKKMVQTRRRSVYREPVRPVEEEPHAIGGWIARIAPDAAPYAGDATALAERADVAPVPAPTPEAMRAVAMSRQAAAKGARRVGAHARRRVLALWVALVVLFLAIFQFLSPSTPTTAHRARAQMVDPTPDLVASAAPTAAALLLLAAFVIAIALATRRSRRNDRAILTATRAMALGDVASAEPLLVALERQARGVAPVQALWLRAKEAERRARFGDALAFVERALATIGAQASGVRNAADLALTPAIVGGRAVALAALGREAEATAELATIATRYAAWGHRAVSELRVRLLMAVRRGDLDAARAIARTRTPELPIPLRDEVLADLVLATAPEGASRDEQERVDTELREDPLLSAWVDAVAPGLRDELARRVAGPAKRIDAAVGEQIQEHAIEEPDLEHQAGAGRAARTRA